MPQTHDITLNTLFGTLRGLRRDGIAFFHRVPFAEPPVGNRRYALPSEPLRWDGVRDALETGHVAPQLPSRLDAVMGTYPMHLDEDCLHLDIWSPVTTGAPAPVLVFLHGGAFMTGGGSLACYDGFLLAKNSGCVIVNVTYRLGPLGFLSQPDFAPTNLGIHDQIAALRWVGKTIAAFGGDPKAITVAGQSAGAFSIAAMLANPVCKDLFQRAILMSAPLGLKLRKAEQAPLVARAMLQALGLDPNDLQALRTLPPEAFLDALRKLQQALPPSTVPGDVAPPFMPVIDGDLIKRDPIEAILEGEGAWCDTIIGITREEYGSFSLGNPLFANFTDVQLEAEFARVFGEEAEERLARARARRVPGNPGAILADLRADEAFVEPSAAFAAAQARNGARSYMYQFDWQAPMVGLGACHCIDLPFLFGNIDTWHSAVSVAGADAQETYDLSHIFQSALTSFVRTGSPEGEGLPAWPSYGENGVRLHVDRRVQAYASI
ncbi:carboxylesterase/lipase family protein [Rhizobium oryzicola]|uniref:Carboxylic ester hydrolase n=1 Tax=Rhizobium oryzicola TaxID=1232668 RepID=A0ABT8T2I0_9HYPH|nr:carboxylesterase family protein [Rhizobium oryzicola]MDO1584836.1 carboxylesterase family protein [Rhizobium oryzicola]